MSRISGGRGPIETASNEPTRRHNTRSELDAGWRYLGPEDLTDGIRARLDAMLADADRRRSDRA